MRRASAPERWNQSGRRVFLPQIAGRLPGSSRFDSPSHRTDVHAHLHTPGPCLGAAGLDMTTLSVLVTAPARWTAAPGYPVPLRSDAGGSAPTEDVVLLGAAPFTAGECAAVGAGTGTGPAGRS